MKCLLCGTENTNFKFNFTGNDIYLKKLNIIDFDLKWYECEECGVYFSKQHENIEKVYEDEALYDAAYDKNEIEIRFNKIMNLAENNSDNVKRVMRCKDYHKEFLKLFSITKDKYNLLDIGAGLGVFLARFMDNNYKVHALELNKVAANHIKKVIPEIIVYQDFMQNINFDAEFDLITLNRVLEHIKTPIDVMKEVKKSLTSSGLVYLELPDTLSYDLDGSSNEAFSSGHYMVYNSKSINYIFNIIGLELMSLSRVKEPSGKYTVYAIGRK